MLPTIIGDVHGRFEEYAKLANGYEKTIQLGDMGIGFGTNENPLRNLDANKHKFIRGNHDKPSACKGFTQYLGDFGLTDDGVFYFSGGKSVDAYLRVPDVDWWHDEELDYKDSFSAYEIYEQTKPRIVCSHECPANVIDEIPNNTKRFSPSTTARTLEMFFSVHQPDIWLFGHHHIDAEFDFSGTHFVAVGTMSVYHLNDVVF